MRIDAYPHLMADEPVKAWTLLPECNQHDWGAPALTKVSRLADNLIEFMWLCKEKKILVGLSSWFRRDTQKEKHHDLTECWA